MEASKVVRKDHLPSQVEIKHSQIMLSLNNDERIRIRIRIFRAALSLLALDMLVAAKVTWNESNSIGIVSANALELA